MGVQASSLGLKMFWLYILASPLGLNNYVFELMMVISCAQLCLGLNKLQVCVLALS